MVEEKNVTIDLTEDEEMDPVQLISFDIISTVGTARSNYIAAIDEASDGNFDEAEALIKEGKEMTRIERKAIKYINMWINRTDNKRLPDFCYLYQKSHM